MKTVDYTHRHRWDDRLGLPHGSVERIVHGSASWLQAQLGQLSIGAYWGDVAHQLQLSADDIQQLAQDFYSGDALDSTLIDLIRRHREAGHAVALLSNDSAELLEKLEKFGISHLFNPLVISAQIGVMKPTAEAYQTVLDRLRISADQAIFIDDRLDNIEGAQALGIHTVHYGDGMKLEVALAPLLNA